jgi:segregation and condensation protein B
MISPEQQKAILEGMLFVSTKPVTLQQMVRKIRQAIRWDREAAAGPTDQQPGEPVATVVAVVAKEAVAVEGVETGLDDGALDQLLHKQKELEDDVSKDEIKGILAAIQASLATADHGVELVCVAKGYQLRTKFEISRLLRDEQAEAPTRLSPSSLETLSVVAYQQPVARQKIEEVRGVDCGGVLKTLLEKGMLRIVGRSEEPGRPLIYGTTPRFLEIFGLNSLRDLPSLSDLADLQLAAPMAEGPGPAEEGVETEELDGLVESLVDAEVADMSVAEKAILEELDASLKDLKDVEKTIM